MIPAVMSRRVPKKGLAKNKKTPGFKETSRIVEYRGLQDQFDVLQDQMDAITDRLDKLWDTMTEGELKYLDSK